MMKIEFFEHLLSGHQSIVITQRMVIVRSNFIYCFGLCIVVPLVSVFEIKHTRISRCDTRNILCFCRQLPIKDVVLSNRLHCAVDKLFKFIRFSR